MPKHTNCIPWGFLCKHECPHKQLTTLTVAIQHLAMATGQLQSLWLVLSSFALYILIAALKSLVPQCHA